MSIGTWFSRHGGGKEPIISGAKLCAGSGTITGQLGALTPVHAPISGTLCAGYRYRAKCEKSISRSRGTGRLRDVTVYAPSLYVELSDEVRVALQTPRSASFGPAEHENLDAMDIIGFRAWEELLALNCRVDVRGRLKAGRDGWILRTDTIVPR